MEFGRLYPICQLFNRKKAALSTQRSERRLLPAGSLITARGMSVLGFSGVHRFIVVAIWLVTPDILSKVRLEEFTFSTSPSPYKLKERSRPFKITVSLIPKV